MVVKDINENKVKSFLFESQKCCDLAWQHKEKKREALGITYCDAVNPNELEINGMSTWSNLKKCKIDDSRPFSMYYKVLHQTSQQGEKINPALQVFLSSPSKIVRCMKKNKDHKNVFARTSHTHKFLLLVYTRDVSPWIFNMEMDASSSTWTLPMLLKLCL